MQHFDLRIHDPCLGRQVGKDLLRIQDLGLAHVEHDLRLCGVARRGAGRHKKGRQEYQQSHAAEQPDPATEDVDQIAKTERLGGRGGRRRDTGFGHDCLDWSLTASVLEYERKNKAMRGEVVDRRRTRGLPGLISVATGDAD